MTKLREAQQNYKDKIGAKQRSFRHTNSILVSCDEKPEDFKSVMEYQNYLEFIEEIGKTDESKGKWADRRRTT